MAKILAEAATFVTAPWARGTWGRAVWFLFGLFFFVCYIGFDYYKPIIASQHWFHKFGACWFSATRSSEVVAIWLLAGLISWPFALPFGLAMVLLTVKLFDRWGVGQAAGLFEVDL